MLLFQIRTVDSEGSIGSSFRAGLGQDPNFRFLTNLISSFPTIEQERLQSISSGSNIPRNQACLSIPAHFARAQQLFDSLHLSHSNRSEIVLNLAYGISVLGESRMLQMHQDLGITYFLRYSPQTLNAAYSTLTSTSDSRPLLLIAANQNDYSGAFYQSSREFESLTSGYRVIITEASSKSQLFENTRFVARRCGPIDTAFFCGHGSQDSILLGAEETVRTPAVSGGILDFFAPQNGPSSNARLNLSDRNELISELGSGVFTRAPTFVLFACSTARGTNDVFMESDSIALMLSEAFNARTFAPTRVSFPALDLSFDFNGRLRNVRFFPGGGSEILSGIPRRVLDDL